jgi:hypothetical protein
MEKSPIGESVQTGIFPYDISIWGFPCSKNFINEVERLHGERKKVFAASAYAISPFSYRIRIVIALLKYFSNRWTAAL